MTGDEGAQGASAVTGEDVYLARTEADEAALAVGFSVAADVETRVSSDGFGVPVVDLDRSGWVAAAYHARDILGMDFLDWLSAVDEPDGDPPGVDVVLHVAATQSTGGPRAGLAPRRMGVRRLMLRTRVPDVDPVVPSLTSVWAGVAWHERETFEMFGVTFTDFADQTGGQLRPLLLPDGFEGTPLRKSFVLAARAVRPWPGAKEPGESATGGRSPGRRKLLPPGVPDPTWGSRAPGDSEEAASPAGNPRGRARSDAASPAGNPRSGVPSSTSAPSPAPSAPTTPSSGPHSSQPPRGGS